MTTTDVLALRYVVTAPGTALGHLVRVLLVSPSGATAAIDRLRRGGLITRIPGTGSHRIGLEATDVGREARP